MQMPRGRASSRPGKVARYAALVGGETGEASPSESGSFGAEDRGDEAHIAGSESGAQPSSPDLFVYVHSHTTDGMSHVKMKVHVARHKFYKKKSCDKTVPPTPWW